MAEDLKVYLDHLIGRESLRYSRSSDQLSGSQTAANFPLRLGDLLPGHPSSLAADLRKPDFQRATWAWTPDDCVSLLETVINRQVVPSIIMWSSPESHYKYILDGGHRISVVLAWLNDDWGDSVDTMEDEEEADKIREAAFAVRNLVKLRIGSIDEYQDAQTAMMKAAQEGQAPKLSLGEKAFKRAMFYNDLRTGNIVFPVLWVPGDYEIAEQSFLKINTGGKQLSEWERKLVRNRNSSMARTVMSIANVTSAKYYWPTIAADTPDEPHVVEKVKSILHGVTQLHDVLLTPPYKTPIQTLDLPLLVAEIKNRPYYLAELLTVLHGYKGHEAEQDRLIEVDRDATPEQIIDNGYKLVQDALGLVDHLVGPSPKSLMLVPSLYFYTDAGRHVRSLLYGLIYWVVSGEDSNQTHSKKLLFSAHRAAIERILMTKKEDVVTGLSRKTGSGTEVTLQTARYFQELLELLVAHNDQTESKEFAKDYKDLANKLKTRKADQSEISSRLFSEKQKSAKVLNLLHDRLYRCEICGGALDLTGHVQHDHIQLASQGGRTSSDNQRPVHPFCNNNRTKIEAVRQGQMPIKLPPLSDAAFDPVAKQLSMFQDPAFLQY